MKYIKSILFIYLIYIPTSAEGNDNFNSRDSSKSIKLCMMYKGIWDQIIINPNYCTMIKKHELSLGLYYRSMKYDYLINFELYPANTIIYGIKTGFINRPKTNKVFSVKFETDALLSLIYTEINFNDVFLKSRPLVAMTLYLGPSFNFKVSKYFDISISIQPAVGYGSNSTFGVIGAIPYGSGLFFDIETLIGLKYRI